MSERPAGNVSIPVCRIRRCKVALMVPADEDPGGGGLALYVEPRVATIDDGQPRGAAELSREDDQIVSKASSGGDEDAFCTASDRRGCELLRRLEIVVRGQVVRRETEHRGVVAVQDSRELDRQFAHPEVIELVEESRRDVANDFSERGLSAQGQIESRPRLIFEELVRSSVVATGDKQRAGRVEGVVAALMESPGLPFPASRMQCGDCSVRVPAGRPGHSMATLHEHAGVESF